MAGPHFAVELEDFHHLMEEVPLPPALTGMDLDHLATTSYAFQPQEYSVGFVDVSRQDPPPPPGFFNPSFAPPPQNFEEMFCQIKAAIEYHFKRSFPGFPLFFQWDVENKHIDWENIPFDQIADKMIGYLCVASHDVKEFHMQICSTKMKSEHQANIYPDMKTFYSTIHKNITDEEIKEKIDECDKKRVRAWELFYVPVLINGQFGFLSGKDFFPDGVRTKNIQKLGYARKPIKTSRRLLYEWKSIISNVKAILYPETSPTTQLQRLLPAAMSEVFQSSMVSFASNFSQFNLLQQQRTPQEAWDFYSNHFAEHGMRLVYETTDEKSGEKYNHHVEAKPLRELILCEIMNMDDSYLPYVFNFLHRQNNFRNPNSFTNIIPEVDAELIEF